MPEHSNKERRETGFTLLEVMIALAIIGISLMVILHTVNFHADVMHDNTVTTRMYQIAKEKLHSLEASRENSKGGIDDTGFTYENIVTESEDSDIVELKTIVAGNGREVTLIELVVSKTQ